MFTIHHDSVSGAVWLEDDTEQSAGAADLYHLSPGGNVVHKNNFAKNALLFAASPKMLVFIKDWLMQFEGWSPSELAKRYDPATLRQVQHARQIVTAAEPPPCPADAHVWVTDSQSNGLCDYCIKCGEGRA